MIPARFRRLRFLLLAAATALCLLPAGTASAQPARNVILFISDGAGFNQFHCASYFRHGELGHEAYDDFEVRLACSTWMLNLDGREQGYDPMRTWEVFHHAKGNEDYTRFTGSAAAATALYTGCKTTIGRVSADRHGRELRTIGQIARARGRSVGAVTSVQLSHATPACLYAHNLSRANYAAIAREMVYASGLTVLCGAGHPEYDNDGRAVGPDRRDYQYVGGEQTWRQLREGSTGKGWTLVEDLEAFRRIAENPRKAPARMLGVPRVRDTLQFMRSGSGMGRLNENVPDLPTLTRAAVSVLARNPEGFLLVVEGGAVDWAGHANDLTRLIQEQIDFNLAVEAVVEWVENHSSWKETLVIVTSDHECGQLWGPGAGENDRFEPPKNNGAGWLPSAKFFSDGHTNALVPLFARGAGARGLLRRVVGRDPVYGPYVDNVHVFEVMRDALVGDLGVLAAASQAPSPLAVPKPVAPSPAAASPPEEASRPEPSETGDPALVSEAAARSDESQADPEAAPVANNSLGWLGPVAGQAAGKESAQRAPSP